MVGIGKFTVGMETGGWGAGTRAGVGWGWFIERRQSTAE